MSTLCLVKIKQYFYLLQFLGLCVCVCVRACVCLRVRVRARVCVCMSSRVHVCVLFPADNVNVAAVRSVTRVLDAWGKRIFNEIKTLVHSQPSALLPDYSRYGQTGSRETLHTSSQSASHL